MQTATQNGNNGINTLSLYVEQRRNELAKVLPRGFTEERFVKLALAAASRNDKLLKCSPESFYVSLHTCVQLGLEPNTPLGEAWLVPYWNNNLGKYEATFQAGYRGLIKLSKRTNEIANIYAFCVHDGDEFSVTGGCNPDIVHVMNFTGEMTHVYAVAKFKDGTEQFDVMTKLQADGIRARSKSKTKEGQLTGPWVSDYEEMAKKTVVKRLCKYLPMSHELSHALERDHSDEIEGTAEVVSVQSATPAQPALEQPRTERLKDMMKSTRVTVPAETVNFDTLDEPSAMPDPVEIRKGHPVYDIKDADKVLNAEASQARRGRPRKAVSQESAAPIPESPTPAVQQTVPVAIATPAPLPVDTGEIEVEEITVEQVLSIGQGKSKITDQHENAYYVSDEAILNKLKGAMMNKKPVQVSWSMKDGRAVIVDTRVTE